MEIGWVGIGRMGFAMAARILGAGHSLHVWNRTPAKAQPLAALGAVLADSKAQLRGADMVFTMLGTGRDLMEVCFGPGGLAADDAKVPGIIIDCSTIGVEESRQLRARLAARGISYLAAPVSGNPKTVAAGKLSSVVSGPRAAFDRAEPVIRSYALHGVSYVGEGEHARICKIAHNVFLAAVIENLMEVTLLAQKAGVPRHAFLAFMNDSVLGSIFTRYKSSALVNLDFTPTFTSVLLRKDVDLGLEAAHGLGVAMPVTAAVGQVLEAHFGVAATKADPQAYLAKDFASLIETLALFAGLTLESEQVPVASGLEARG